MSKSEISEQDVEKMIHEHIQRNLRLEAFTEDRGGWTHHSVGLYLCRKLLSETVVFSRPTPANDWSSRKHFG